MIKCHAFKLISGSKTVWVPCNKPAEPDSYLCRHHYRAVAGVLLGAVAYPEFIDFMIPETPSSFSEVSKVRPTTTQQQSPTARQNDGTPEVHKRPSRRYLM